MAESNNATQLHNKSFPFHVEFYFIINMASFMKQDKERRNQQQQKKERKNSATMEVKRKKQLISYV